MFAFDKAPWIQKLILSCARLPVLGPLAVATGMRWKLGRSFPHAKVRNFLLANLESARKTIRVRSLPYAINLDTLNGCNLACPFCPTGTKQLDRQKTRLPLEHGKAVIDKVKDHVIAARFYNWGEPFLNPEVFELIRHASDAGIWTTISSNMSINVPDLAEKILDSGLDNLHVSIDGLEQATLDRYRRKADIDLVLKNVRRLVELKRQRGSQIPKLNLVFLVFKHNEHELERIPAMKKELGVDSFTPSKAFIYHDSFVPEHPDYQPAQVLWRHSCHYLYSELMVEADGHVSPCCTNTSVKFDLGTTDALDDINGFWNNPRYLAMRARSAGLTAEEAGIEPMETLCDTCSFVGDAKADGRLSPLPPSLVAAGESYDHGLDRANAEL